MTKVIEVINNVLSIASNKEIGLFIKLLIVLVVIVFFGVISFSNHRGNSCYYCYIDCGGRRS